MSILVTGAKNGLGKFLAEKFGTIGFTRQSDFQNVEGEHFDVIVHCAFNTNNCPPQDKLHGYAYDNIVLTHKLINEVTSDRFVFISSIDVYPTDMNPKDEDYELNINEVNNIYGQTKLISENIVSLHSNHLILRCGGIIGPTKCPKSIFDITSSKRTTLSRDSILSYIPQQAIYDIITTPSWESGTYNVASDVPMAITDLEKIYGPITYGNYTYKATNVPTGKLKIHFPRVKIPSSKDTLLSVLGKT